MKKSKSIKLVLLGTAALALTSCGQEKIPSDATFVKDTKECVEKHYHDAYCQASIEATNKAHEQTAPKFARKEECEQQFGTGNCETKNYSGDTNSGGIFMPMLIGYMLGSMNGSGFNRPIYPGPNNTAMMPTQRGFSNVGSYTPGAAPSSSTFRSNPAVVSKPTPTKVGSSTSQRNGFGASSRRFSGGSAGG